MQASFIFMAAVTTCSDFGAQENKKPVTLSIFSLSICHEVTWPDAMILVFRMLSFKPGFSLSSFTLIKRLFSSSSLSPIRVVSSEYLRLLIFLSAILIPPVIHPARHFTWCTLHMSHINEWQYTALKGLTSLRMIMEIMMIDDNGNYHPKWSQIKKDKYHVILLICRI